MVARKHKKPYEAPITEIVSAAAQPMLYEGSWTPNNHQTTLPVEVADDGNLFPSLDDLYGDGNTSGGSGKRSGESAKRYSFDYEW